MSEEEKRKKYLDALEKRVNETPDIRHIIQESKTDIVELDKKPLPKKDKKEG